MLTQPNYRDTYRNFAIRAWQPQDRQAAIALIGEVLQEYGLSCEPDATDQDAFDVETHYWQTGGAFWVVEQMTRFWWVQPGIIRSAEAKKAVRNSQKCICCLR